MAGIDDSKCVIAFITSNYLQRARDRHTNVYKEFQYAAVHKKGRVILVVLEECCLLKEHWKGSVVEFHCGGDLYVDMTPRNYEKGFLELCNRIKKNS